MVALVVVGSLVYVFITSLLAGVQKSVVDSALSETSQVTVQATDDDPKLILPRPNDQLVLADVQSGRERPERIGEWRATLASIAKLPEIEATSPVAAASGFVTKGGKTKPVTMNGVREDLVSGINALNKKIVSGTVDFTSKRIVIGVELAKSLSCQVGDKLQVRSEAGTVEPYTVAGIFEFGTKDQNERTAYCSLEDGQRLAGIVGYINRIEIRLKDVNTADSVAAQVRSLTGLKVVPWTEQFRDINSALAQIDLSKNMIRSFALISVAFGIASVLGVSVAQKSKEIGILKGMGAQTSQILWIFILSGGLIGLIGAPLGAGLGALLVNLLASIPPKPGESAFPALFDWSFFWQAVIVSNIVCLLSGLGPARRASLLNPVEAIRNV
ncbi:MAG: ABC transporter permease [Fimbriimonas sp.]